MIRIAAKYPSDGLHDSCSCVADANSPNSHAFVDKPVEQGLPFGRRSRINTRQASPGRSIPSYRATNPMSCGSLDAEKFSILHARCPCRTRWPGIPLLGLGRRWRDDTSLAFLHQLQSALTLCLIRLTGAKMKSRWASPDLPPGRIIVGFSKPKVRANDASEGNVAVR